MSEEPLIEYAGRFTLAGRTLREFTARGTIVNTVFLVALTSLGLIRGFVLARFVSASDYGVWGVLLVSVGTLLFLKQVGVGDKYIQQEEEDQEVAFQKAFTLEMFSALAVMVLVLIAAPILAAAYGSKVLGPALVMALLLPGLALQAPQWVLYRRMDFVGQRLLQSVDPIVGFVVAIGLAIAGAGYWALVAGILAGTWASAITAVIACPYPLRFRFDRVTARDYLSFSWPLLLVGGSGLLVAQVSIIVGTDALGLAGAGAITLSAAVVQFTDRVDQIVTGTLYPAICAVADRTAVLHESFVKSNRLALIWAMPFGLGLTLFAPDLVHHVLGHRWDLAILLIQAFGAIAAFNHIGFNWDAYYRARGETRPIAVVAVTVSLVFVAIAIPLMYADGLRGLAIAMGIQAVVGLVLRAYYLRRLFAGFGLARHAVRAMAPSVPAVAAVLIARQLESGPRSSTVAAAEFCGYLALTVLATLVLERRLLREAVGYLRGTPMVAA